MDRLECDRMFVAVIDTGSFSRAAERLGTSSGQASKLVSRLEAELGVQLLTRTTRALSPTEVGRAYHERVKPLLEELDALDASVRNAAGAPSGRLRISAPVSFGTVQLVPVLADFARAFPGIVVDVDFADRMVRLVDEGFDAAVRIGAPGDSALIARRLCEVRVVTVAAPAYMAARGTPDSPADLLAHDCIADSNTADPANWRFRGQVAPIRERMRFSNAEACVIAAEAGLGITQVPSFVAGDGLRAGRLRIVLPEVEPDPRGLFVIYPPGRHLAGKVRVLVDFLAMCFRGLPDWDKGW
ncbi:MAG: LysR family transcriptional regulator [Paracoccaceae bacterium]